MHGRWVLGGGLASGKSVVRRLLGEAGVLTLDADSVGHRVLEPDGGAYAEVAATWPEVVTAEAVDRGALAGIVFGNPEELARLEAITHPHIFDAITAMVKGVDGPVVVEVPLLEHGLGEGWRRMVVDSRDDVRSRRAVSRGMAAADAEARMRAQPSRAQWLASADLVIPNHSGLPELEAAVSMLAGRLQP